MDPIDYNAVEQLKLIDGYVSEKNDECANVLAVEMKNPDFDLEDFILQQNRTINNFADVLKYHIKGYSEAVTKCNSLAESFNTVYEDNKRLQNLLKLNFDLSGNQ